MTPQENLDAAKAALAAASSASMAQHNALQAAVDAAQAAVDADKTKLTQDEGVLTDAENKLAAPVDSSEIDKFAADVAAAQAALDFVVKVNDWLSRLANEVAKVEVDTSITVDSAMATAWHDALAALVTEGRALFAA